MVVVLLIMIAYYGLLLFYVFFKIINQECLGFGLV